jgi:hypothetical protein
MHRDGDKQKEPDGEKDKPHNLTRRVKHAGPFCLT